MYRIFSYVPTEQTVDVIEKFTVSQEEFTTFEEALAYIQEHVADFALGSHCLGYVKHGLDKSVFVSSCQKMIYLGYRVDVCITSGPRIIFLVEQEVA